MLLAKFLEFTDESGMSIELLFTVDYHPLDGPPTHWTCVVPDERMKAIVASSFANLTVTNTSTYKERNEHGFV